MAECREGFACQCAADPAAVGAYTPHSGLLQCIAVGIALAAGDQNSTFFKMFGETPNKFFTI